MKSILILGSLSAEGGRKELYDAIILICRKFSENVSSPIDTAAFKGGERERYERAFEKVREAGLVIGEQSLPSTGQGMELREAAVLNKPIIIIAKSKSKISPLVHGCPAVKETIFYRNMDDLEEKLVASLQKNL